MYCFQFIFLALCSLVIASFRVDVRKIGELGILSREFSQKPFWQSSEEIQDRLSSEGQFHMSDSVVDTSLEEEIESLEKKNSKRQYSSSGPVHLEHNNSETRAGQKALRRRWPPPHCKGSHPAYPPKVKNVEYEKNTDIFRRKLLSEAPTELLLDKNPPDAKFQEEIYGKNTYTGGVESTRWKYHGNELEITQYRSGGDDVGLKKIGVGAGIVQYLICQLPGMRRKKLPKIVSNPVDNLSIWALATCGFLWTSSTCMVFSLLPVFLHSELGFSNTRIGAVEGFALVVSNFSRVFSGVLSDMLKSRVKVIAVGSVMTAMMKLVLASALSVQWVVMAKLLDRFGKGIRAAPTDALIADLSPRPKRSSSYGLHQSMTTLGGVLGSITAVVCMKLTQNNFRATFTAAAVPSIFAIVILLSYVKNPQRAMEKPNYTPRPGRGRGLPSWRRHARGPLAMPHLRARWRRIECRDMSRDVAWHHRQQAWKNVREWLLQIQKRAVVVAPFLDQVVEGLDDGEFTPRSTVQLKRTPSGTMIKKVDREAQHHGNIRALGTDDLQERAYIWADDPWADEEKSRATLNDGRTKTMAKSDDMIVGWGEWSWSWSEAVQLPREFWRALFVFSILKVARFSEAFVTLHARAIGMQVAYLPILMFATNIVQSILTYPLGVIADKGDLNGASGRNFMLLC